MWRAAGERNGLQQEKERLEEQLAGATREARNLQKENLRLTMALVVLAAKARLASNIVEALEGSNLSTKLEEVVKMLAVEEAGKIGEEVLPRAEEIVQREARVAALTRERGEKWISPVGEATDLLVDMAMPLADKLDGLLEETRLFLGELEYESFRDVADVLEKIDKKVFGSKVQLFARLARYFRTNSINELSEMQPKDVVIFRNHLLTLQRVMGQVDNALSRPFTWIMEAIDEMVVQPLLSAAKETIQRVAERARKRVQPVLDEVDNVLDAKERAEREMALLDDPDTLKEILTEGGALEIMMRDCDGKDSRNCQAASLDEAVRRIVDELEKWMEPSLLGKHGKLP